MRKRIIPLVVSALALVAAACGDDDDSQSAAAPTTPTTAAPAVSTPAFPVTIDNAGVKVTIASRPSRIVSLSPTATESLFAIGAGAQVLAVDDQSTYPASAPRTELSGFKPNIEAIAAKSPDLIVVSNDINNVVAGLRALKLPVLLQPAANTIDEAYAELRELGDATGNAAGATKTIDSMRSRIDAVIKTIKPGTSLKVYHELDPTYFSVTSTTFVGAIYKSLGLVNIADAADKASSGYPQLSAEYIVKANPDLIMLADSKCCAQNAKTVAARSGFSELTAVRKGGVIELDDDIASRWGPRTAELYETVVKAVTAVTGR